MSVRPASRGAWRPGGSWAWGGPDACRAFTLFELLAVLSIMAILMGVAAGYLRAAGRKLDVTASASTVESVIRLCRDHSRERGLPSRVVFDQDSGALWGAAHQVVGEWHFESLVGGQIPGYGNPGRAQGGELLDRWIGRRWGNCYLFPEGQSAYVDCGTSTAFDGRHGVLVEGCIYLERAPPAGGMTIFRKGKVFSLSLNGAAQLEAEVALEGKGTVRLVTSGRPLGLRNWWRVALDHDGELLRIHVNHTQRAAASAEGLLQVEEQNPFQISDAERPFQGIMDEVRLSMLMGNTRRQLARGVTFAEAYPPLRFGWDGTLDLGAMELAQDRKGASQGGAEPLTLPLEITIRRTASSGVGQDQRTIQVDFYGSITILQRDQAPAAEAPPRTADPPPGGPR